MREIIWDVDTQKDFMSSDGRLHVPGAEDIKANIRDVLLAAQENDLSIFGSVDAHMPEDKEFEQYPIHCLIGHSGQDKIDESIVSHQDNIYFIPNNGNGFDMNVFEGAQQIYFEKQCTDIWDKCLGQPDNIQTMFRLLDVTDIYVIGVATNICVIDAVRGFRSKKYKVHIITDATKGIDISDNNSYPVNKKLALEEMKKLGCSLITTDEFIKEV